MLVERSWRNKNIDGGFCTLKKKDSNLWKLYPRSFGLNKAQHFVESTEEEYKNTLELKFISDVDVANMIHDRF